MINIVAKIRKTFIILPVALFILVSCPRTDKVNADKTPVVSTDEKTEAIDEDDEEYDSSNVYSQDSDN